MEKIIILLFIFGICVDVSLSLQDGPLSITYLNPGVPYQKIFFDELGKNLGMNSMEDWYNVTFNDLKRNGASGILHIHRTLYQTLKSIYPEYNWQEEIFLKGRSRISAFEYNQNQQQYTNSHKHKSEDGDDDGEKIEHQTMNSLSSGGISKRQLRLFNLMLDLFPSHNIHLKFLHPHLKYNSNLDSNPISRSTLESKSNNSMELDIYIPSLNLAVEYQGIQHYENNFFFGDENSVNIQSLNDKNKKIACEEIGITLIQIPHWWDGSRDTFISTLFKHRPDLESLTSMMPIPPLTQPPNRIK